MDSILVVSILWWSFYYNYLSLGGSCGAYIFPKGSLLYVWIISELYLQQSFSDDILFDFARTIQPIYNVKFNYVLPIYCDHFVPLLAPSAASLIFLAACVSK
jgi:hypothetical protein